jgi:hypothetical protein
MSTDNTGPPDRAIKRDRVTVATIDLSCVKNTTDRELITAALRVRAVYAQERSRFETLKVGEPVRHYPSKKYNGRPAVTIDGDDRATLEAFKGSTWVRFISWCRTRKIDPEVYVRLCFQGMSLKRIGPEPPDLLGPKFETKWAELYPRLPSRLTLALQVQHEDATSRVALRHRVMGDTIERARLFAYSAGDLALSPLYRYCAAEKEPSPVFRPLAQSYAAEAMMQYMCYPHVYAETWADVLPADFGATCDRAYPHLLRTLGHDMTDLSEPDLQ